MLNVKDLTTRSDKRAAVIGKYPALVGPEPSEPAQKKEINNKIGPTGQPAQ